MGLFDRFKKKEGKKEKPNIFTKILTTEEETYRQKINTFSEDDQ